jgi:hypothetical protein
MATYDNVNRGALFRDDKKVDDGDRDYSGQLNVGGVEYWLSGWIKTSSKTGRKFLSLSLKPKNAETPKQPKPDFDDAVPF